MIQPVQKAVPEDHEVRDVFRSLAARGLEQVNNRDVETASYLAEMLTEFVPAANVCRIRGPENEQLEYGFGFLAPPEGRTLDEQRDFYKHIGDTVLFHLGLFPEHLRRRRRCLSESFYADQGRRSYGIVSELEHSSRTRVFRKLSDQFDECVEGLHWVSIYLHDPFFQYVFRQFRVI